MNILSFEAQVRKATTQVDGGLKLEIITQELSPQNCTDLFSLKGKHGWIAFKETAITLDDLVDLPEETKEFKNDKTPSQRLRAVLYKKWETTKREKTFNDFYSNYMERLIAKLKETLD